MSLSIESFISRAVVNLKSDSHELCLMHAAASEVLKKKKNSYLCRNATVCRSCTSQKELM